jgi:hypothetical protein
MAEDKPELFDHFRSAFREAGDYWWMSNTEDNEHVHVQLYKGGQPIAYMKLNAEQSDHFLKLFLRYRANLKDHRKLTVFQRFQRFLGIVPKNESPKH